MVGHPETESSFVVGVTPVCSQPFLRCIHAYANRENSPSPNDEMVTAGVQNKMIRGTLLLSRLAVTNKGGWQWTVRDVPAITPEPRMPPFLSLAGANRSKAVVLNRNLKM
jgi:hypothetical protein